MKAWAEYLVGPYRGSPLRIGYFSDNEVGWWNGTLWVFYIQKPSTNYTKQRLVELLREHYGGDWRRFSVDFVADGLGSFDAAAGVKGRVPRLRPGGNGIQVVRRWTGQVPNATTGWSTMPCARRIRTLDPRRSFTHLLRSRRREGHGPVRGRRFGQLRRRQPGRLARALFLRGLRQLAGKPVLISEWFFSAQENRSGNLNSTGLMTVATQAERARGVVAASQNFADIPR